LGAQLPVAIKVLHLHQVDNAEVVRRFQREARALSQLRHPQIVKMIDFGMLPQFGFYLVMEFLRGATLYERLRAREVFPIRRLIPLFRGLCDVLRFVHEKGIVHRDLKLSNIYLTEEHGIEKVTLLDFGIAAVADDIDMITKTGAYIGTATYASPEQAMGMKELDGRSDLYALAILLYRLLVGRPPFEGLNSMEITHRKLSEAPPTLASMVPHRMWTPQLEAFFQTALSREPEGRPHDASVFWEHCHKALVAQMELDRQGDSTLKDAPKTEVSQRVPIEQLSGEKPGSVAAGARESVGASISIQQSDKLHTLDFTEGDSVAISPEELLVSGATQEWQGPQEVLDAIVAAQPQHEEESSSKATISTSSLSFVSTEELDSFAGDVPAVTAPEGLLLAEAVARSAGDAGATLDEGLAMSTRREKGLDAEAFDDQTLVSEEVSGQGQVDEAFADQTHADAIVGRVARSRFEGARTQLTEMTFSPTLADGTGDELSITAPPVSSAPVANNGSEKSDGSAWSWMVGGGIVLAVALAILLFWVL
jgi:serine/threonine protein kinase